MLDKQFIDFSYLLDTAFEPGINLDRSYRDREMWLKQYTNYQLGTFLHVALRNHRKEIKLYSI